MKILFSGGGTLGPVTPLLAIRESISKQYPDAEFVWIGTSKGPERQLVEEADVRFVTLVSGKLRRYISFWNLIDIFKIIIAFFQSFYILWRENPDVCVSAGGYVSVPLHWAAWWFGIPMWIHQQDIRVGLANRLMVGSARVITTATKAQMKHFPKRKTQWLGNPVREEIVSGSKKEAQQLFDLKKDLPVIFIMGGGTGSMRVNQMVAEAVGHLSTESQVLHLSGRERPQDQVVRAMDLYDTYHVYQFFTHEMKHAYAAADIIVSRGGFGSLTEIAALGKPAIIIPKPGHQVQNVKQLEKSGAVIYVDERTSNGLHLSGIIKDLLRDTEKQTSLAQNLSQTLPRARDEHVGEIIENLVK